VIAKAVEEVVKAKSGWLVKQENSHGTTQYWSMKNDYFGETPEEAITKAVADIEKRKREYEENKRQAGIC
jgi:hypothetical protein